MRQRDAGCDMDLLSERSAGVLLHVSSLPGRYGMGTMGAEARAFIDFLAGAGFRCWQVLPLVQTGFGDSPYQSVYGASGNPCFIDPELLAEEGLLHRRELAALRAPAGPVDFDFVRATRLPMLRKAFSRFDRSDPAFRAFCEEGLFADYALFMAAGEKYGGGFFRWPRPLRQREEEALSAFRRENEGEVLFWLFVQFKFLQQWSSLRAYANGKGIRIIGDIPLYMAYDSVDVWANPRLFKLNRDLTRKKVAGVPPDYFSETGQLWGNPVYDWRAHEREGFAWWTERIRRAFMLYDAVRIDHFRGFDRYFEIDAAAQTAVGGEWKKGPGMKLFGAVRERLGSLSFIAEDLGTIDDGVRRLMKRTGFPGMKVLQFAFDGNPGNPYLPSNIGEDSVCYTGTHDNDTLVGFLSSMQGWEFENFARIVKPHLRAAGIPARLSSPKGAAACLRALALSVRSELCVLPMQDILLLGGDARMNVPGTPSGNWRFRLAKLPSARIAEECRALLSRYGRLAER